jgi:transcriptional regulator with XRE-family HTH domain
MPKNSANDIEETKKVQQERAQKWSEYFRQLVREWQYQDASGGRIFLSKSELGRLIKVSDVTVSQWWEGRAFPSRQNCALVAIAFGKSISPVLDAAGYMINQDDSYNTMNEIMNAVERDMGLEPPEKKRLSDALIMTITPNWIANNPDWIDLVRVVLNQHLSLLIKAERIASIVELSKQS